jgi:hypothetical protein
MSPFYVEGDTSGWQKESRSFENFTYKSLLKSMPKKSKLLFERVSGNDQDQAQAMAAARLLSVACIFLFCG